MAKLIEQKSSIKLTQRDSRKARHWTTSNSFASGTPRYMFQMLLTGI